MPKPNSHLPHIVNFALLQRLYTSNPVKRNFEKQQKVLIKLLENSINSAFGKQYRFNEILAADDVITEFKKRVPVSSYLTMKDWWVRCLNGEEDVVIDGPIKYFALSSGTSDGASKFIPVSKGQLSQLRRQGLRMSLNIARNKIYLPQPFVSTTC